MTKGEYILCAAIWYKELSLIRDDFPTSHLRPVNCEKGIVFCGQRHLQCLYQMIAMTGKVQHEAGEEVQGFLTNMNRFVGREEALYIARKAGQLLDMRNVRGNQLYSEDLY
jgi:hypothetical protein